MYPYPRHLLILGVSAGAPYRRVWPDSLDAIQGLKLGECLDIAWYLPSHSRGNGFSQARLRVDQLFRQSQLMYRR
jgi:hypothetical protein